MHQRFIVVLFCGKSVSIAIRGFQHLVSFRFLDPEDHQNWSSCVGSPSQAVNLEPSGGSEVQSDAPSEDAPAEDVTDATDATDATAEDVPGESSEASEASAERSLSHLKDAVHLADALAQDGHVRGGASAATLCSLSWLFWHLSAISSELRQEVMSDCHAWSISCSDWTWSKTLEAACANFHSQVGFSSQLPRGLFQVLEASEDPEAQRLVERCRQCFGRFYPKA